MLDACPQEQLYLRPWLVGARPRGWMALVLQHGLLAAWAPASTWGSGGRQLRWGRAWGAQELSSSLEEVQVQ